MQRFIGSPPPEGAGWVPGPWRTRYYCRTCVRQLQHKTLRRSVCPRCGEYGGPSVGRFNIRVYVVQERTWKLKIDPWWKFWKKTPRHVERKVALS